MCAGEKYQQGKEAGGRPQQRCVETALGSPWVAGREESCAGNPSSVLQGSGGDSPAVEKRH